MAESKKPKTVKKVTEIQNASVKIEVEETEDSEKVVTDENEEAPKEEASVETPEKSSEDEVIENFDNEGLNWKKVILIILIVVPLGFLIFGGFLYFSKNLDINKVLNKTPDKTLEIPESTPTPTPEEIDKEAYEIEVQNGSGIAGEGARVKEILDKAGFKTGAVGNADSATYTATIITVNDDVTDGYIEALTKILEERGSVGKVEKFASGVDGEVLVIIGSDVTEEEEDEEETTPTPTP